nr:hypothetical protein [Myxosarcina sp. GI1]
MANLKEATELYLAEFPLLDTSRRLITTEDFILYLNFKTYCYSSSLQERVQKNPS